MVSALSQILLDEGASLVGAADLRGMYAADASATVPQEPYGIAIAVAIPAFVIRGIADAPTRAYFDAYHSINDTLDRLAARCASYLTQRGYRAYAQTEGAVQEYGTYRTQMPHKTVAVRAGLGWIGKSALFVTQEYGSAVRLTSVLTDAPVTPGKAVTTSRCGACTLCRDACPGGAISGKLWSAGVYRDSFFDPLLCRAAARERAAAAIGEEITLCGKCIEVCPYTKQYLRRSE